MTFAILKTSAGDERMQLEMIERYIGNSKASSSTIYYQNGNGSVGMKNVLHSFAEITEVIGRAKLAGRFLTLSHRGESIGVNTGRIISYSPSREGTEIQQTTGIFVVDQRTHIIDEHIEPNHPILRVKPPEPGRPAA